MNHETNRNQNDRLAAIRRWISENGVRVDGHPCYVDLVCRIESVKRLQQTAPCPQPQEYHAESGDDPAISLPCMTLTVQLDRCEALIEILQTGKPGKTSKGADQILYPPLSIALLQRIIQLIVTLKNRIGISDKTYSSASLLHLCYIKAPPGLTRVISRLMPKLW